MNETVLVTGYRPTKFATKENGEEKTIDMIKVSYLTKFSDSKGHLPLQVVFMDDQKPVVLSQLTKVPGLYDVQYAMVPGKNNKPTMQVVGFSYVKDVDLKPLFK